MNDREQTLDSAPRVSVMMALNRMDGFLQPAIESILDQTFSNFELLVIADSSCPGLTERVLECGQGDSRIRIIPARIGGGVAFSRNLAIAEARGEYIAVMDGDDVSRPERLRLEVEYLDSHPDVVVVSGRMQMIDQDSREIRRPYPFFQTDKEIRRVLPYRLPVPHAASMFRKTALIEVQGYKHDHSGAEDYEMIIRMARNPGMKFYNLDCTVLDYRRHPSQLTHTNRMRHQYADISGFLYTEFLRTHSPKYILGMLILHPWARRARLSMRKLLSGSEL
jgi:glycosyltransferase involved in cell wall biosynthesis